MLGRGDTHFDVIIIGTGAGGGTLAYALAPTGKRILLLDRGDYIPEKKQTGTLKRLISRGVTAQRNAGATIAAKSLPQTSITGLAVARRFMARRYCGCDR